MTSAVFVHGTGVRKDAYDASFALVEAALGKLGVSAHRCYWGHLGSDLHAKGASIPRYDSTRAIASDGSGASPEDYTIALWAMLYDDPFYELRVLALRRGPARERPMGQVAPGAALALIASQFVVSPALQTLLRQGEIDQVFAAARTAVTTAPAYAAALNAASEALGEDRAAIARAIISESLTLASKTGVPARAAVDRELRDAIETALIEALGGGERSIGGWVKGQLLGVVYRIGSSYTARRRGAITDGAHPAAGDILLYQARGTAIGECILADIRKAPPPRVVVAHSLGGIACVDLLANGTADVDLLVTVGSQAPFLYEIDALQSLRYGQPLPAHFPRWTNIYDLRDFLSYIGAALFPTRVTDVEVDNGQPFPVSHSAYWSNPAVWQAVAKALP